MTLEINIYIHLSGFPLSKQIRIFSREDFPLRLELCCRARQTHVSGPATECNVLFEFNKCVRIPRNM